MLAVSGAVPVGPGWALEFKWDGVRAVSTTGSHQTRLWARNGNDVTRSYPELEVLADLLDGRRAVLDGEIVVLGPDGRPRFDLLQRRMHVHGPPETLMRSTPVAYFVFDLLHLDGRSLVDQPYQRRKELLGELGLDRAAAHVRVPPYYLDVDGRHLVDIARAHGLEGVVAKRVASRYEPGRRSPAWVKTALMTTQEVLIGGWKPGEGRRAGTIGSLLLGACDDDGRLVYLGHVGTGFTDRMLHELAARLAPLRCESSPFDESVPREHARHARWVRPSLVGEVEYRTLTADGRLRHASWRGLRADKDPAEVAVSQIRLPR